MREAWRKGESRNAAHYPSSFCVKPIPNKISRLRRE
jgi:hypothetical protein